MLQEASTVSDVLQAEVRRAARSRWITWGVIAAVAVIAAGGIWLWWSAGQRNAVARYQTEPAALADIAVTVVATGTLEPAGHVDVSSQMTGTIASVEAEVNDKVSKGQPLARLDQSDLEVRLSRAAAVLDGRKASRLTAQANLADAEMALDRATALSSGQNVSVRDFELAQSAQRRAKASLAMADADVKAAEADLQTARNDLGKACICSPIDGVVLESNATQGQSIVAANLVSPLFIVAEDLSRLELQADVDEADVGQVKEGDPATFTVEAWPDRRFEGKIRQLRFSPTTTDGVVTYRAVLSVDNPDLLLRPGMSATADIIVDQAKAVLAVPNAALRFTPEPAASGNGFSGAFGSGSTIKPPTSPSGTPSIWVMRDKAPQQIAVTTGLTDGQHAEITGGDLKAGDAVIVGTDAR